MTDDTKTGADKKDDSAQTQSRRRPWNTWRCPPGLWRRWRAALPEGSDPVVTMMLRVKGLVRNAERQAGQDVRMTSWVLPAGLADRIAEAAERDDMSPSEWAAIVLARALDHSPDGA